MSEFDPDRIVQAAHDHNGVVLQIAQEIGCSARTVYRYMERYDRVRKAVQAGRENTYSEATASLVEAMRGNVDGVDQQWALKKVLETFGEAVQDGLNFHPKQRQTVEGKGIGITVLPPEQANSTVRDSRELEGGDLETLPEG